VITGTTFVLIDDRRARISRSDCTRWRWLYRGRSARV